jgi:hypothetical protein
MSLSTNVRAASCEYICMTVVTRMYAVCVYGLLTVGCGPSVGVEPERFANDSREPVEIALDIYEQAHGEAVARCVELAYVTEFVEMDSDELAIECGTEKHAAGACFVENDSTPKVVIDLEDAGSKRLRAHELMHVLLDCQSGSKHDSDGLHANVVWETLDPDAVGWTAKRRDWK